MKIRGLSFLRALGCGSILAAACVAVASCALGGSGDVTVMAYNTQAFFDAMESGSEFAEYRGGKTRWNAERYGARLDRLREAILLAGVSVGAARDRGPDVVVLEEIESEAVLRDLCNRMPRNAGYAYAVFAPPEKNCAFGSAIITRCSVSSVTIHSVSAGGVPLRPLIEATLDVGGTPLVVFAAHWKSKSGESKAAGSGASSADIRAAQERLLAGRIRELESRSPGSYWIACGDFNQKPDEFSEMTEFVNCWAALSEIGASAAASGPSGSYWYDGDWEAIDHFFMPREPAVLHDALPLFSVGEFRVVAVAPLVDADVHPASYSVFSGRGYSDHLPIVQKLERRR